MPVSFKPPRLLYIVTKTPQEDLEFCDVCGGINAMASTAVKVNCESCGTTGYSNYYTRTPVFGSYRPGGDKRWNPVEGAVSYFGECSVKLPAIIGPFLEEAVHIEMDGTPWNFNVMRTPGAAFGQERIVLSLSRK